MLSLIIMNELKYDEYLEKFRSWTSKQLSLRPNISRGFDKRGHLILIDGMNEQSLMPPEVILNLTDFNKNQQEYIQSLIQKQKMIILEAVQTNNISDFQRKKLSNIHDEYIAAKQLDTKIQNKIQAEKSGLTLAIIELQKSLKTSQNNLAERAKHKAQIHDNNLKDESYQKEAISYIQDNRKLLDVSRSLDETLKQTNLIDNFIIRHPAILIKAKTLKPDSIRVKLQ